jgi:hypothetical protein
MFNGLTSLTNTLTQFCFVMAKVGNSIGVNPPDHRPAQPAQSKHNQRGNQRVQKTNGKCNEKEKNLQLQKATTKPTEFAATRVVELSNMYPQAKRINSMSRKNRVNHSTHELRIAATVKMTVRINQAQQYMPSALLKSGLICPLASVYAGISVSVIIEGLLG